MNSITVTLQFDAAHRLLGHRGKCRHVHGHTYTAFVEYSAPGLNQMGMVIDFSEVKQALKTWINSYWDHNLILHPSDPLWEYYRPRVGVSLTEQDREREPYTLTYNSGNRQPTAENMAEELYRVACEQVAFYNWGIKVERVSIQETPGCLATFYAPDDIGSVPPI